MPGKFVQVFTLHTQCTNYDYSPECIPLTRQNRDFALHEMLHFMETKSDANSSWILAGDFNINRYPHNETMRRKIVEKNPLFADTFHYIDEEYDSMLNILKNEGNFTVENCWERDNANADAPLVTFGESYLEKQVDGTMKEIPMETLLTTPID